MLHYTRLVRLAKYKHSRSMDTIVSCKYCEYCLRFLPICYGLSMPRSNLEFLREGPVFQVEVEVVLVDGSEDVAEAGHVDDHRRIRIPNIV